MIEEKKIEELKIPLLKLFLKNEDIQFTDQNQNKVACIFVQMGCPRACICASKDIFYLFSEQLFYITLLDQ